SAVMGKPSRGERATTSRLNCWYNSSASCSPSTSARRASESCAGALPEELHSGPGGGGVGMAFSLSGGAGRRSSICFETRAVPLSSRLPWYTTGLIHLLFKMPGFALAAPRLSRESGKHGERLPDVLAHVSAGRLPPFVLQFLGAQVPQH